MRLPTAIALVVGLAPVVGACGAGHMEPCESSADCASPYECLRFDTEDYTAGKVCTVACEAVAECPATPPPDTCGDPVCEEGTCGFEACLVL